MLEHEKWHAWFELGGYASNERSRGEGGQFTPLWQSGTALLFTDIRGKFFTEDTQEGNFALGLRAMRPSGWNLGVWGAWDVRHTELDSTFHQASFGIETLTADFDFRANGYVGTDRSHVSTSVNSTSTGTSAVATATTQRQQGNTISTVTTTTTTTTRTTRFQTTRVFEHALYGFDAEIGFRVPLEHWFASGGGGLRDGPASGRRRHELRLYGGGFWFDDDGVEEKAGPRARAELRFNDIFAGLPGSRLTFEGEFQYDDVRKDQWEGGVRLRIPFGGRRDAALAGLSAQELRMMERLERDMDILTNTGTTTSTTTTTSTGSTNTTSQTTIELEPEEPEEG